VEKLLSVVGLFAVAVVEVGVEVEIEAEAAVAVVVVAEEEAGVEVGAVHELQALKLVKKILKVHLSEALRAELYQQQH